MMWAMSEYGQWGGVIVGAASKDESLDDRRTSFTMNVLLIS